MIYILNPGEGLGVKRYGDRTTAETQHIQHGRSRLYSVDRGQWREFSRQGSWHRVLRSNLPVKVVEAGR